MIKTIHATQNEDGTYRVVIKEGETEIIVGKADIRITVYAEKDNDEILSFITKE